MHMWSAERSGEAMTHREVHVEERHAAAHAMHVLEVAEVVVMPVMAWPELARHALSGLAGCCHPVKLRRGQERGLSPLPEGGGTASLKAIAEEAMEEPPSGSPLWPIESVMVVLNWMVEQLAMNLSVPDGDGHASLPQAPSWHLISRLPSGRVMDRTIRASHD